MRTLKKTLSLILALALCLSLGSVALANPLDDYTDTGSVGATYYQAVETLVGLGIIEGTGNAMLSPAKTYTREEAAKVVTYLLVGPEAAEVIGKTAVKEKPFTDVEATRWSAGYIAFCAKQGILDGVGGGKFDPTGTLTGYQWAKMLLCALGYGTQGEYLGEDWAINAAKDSIPLGIFADDLSGANNKSITRQQAILYAFNTLWLNRVAYNKDTGKYIMDDDDGLGGGAGGGFYLFDMPMIAGSNTEAPNGQLVTGVGYYGTIAWNIYGIARSDFAIVVANEEANLADGLLGGGSPLPDGETAFVIFLADNVIGEQVPVTAAALKWSSRLDDLGESRKLVFGVKNGVVYSCVDTGLNAVTELENGDAFNAAVQAALGWDGNTIEFVNYDMGNIKKCVSDEGARVKLGDYIKVIDFDGDGYADLALGVHWTQDRIEKIDTVNGTVTTNGGWSFDYVSGDKVGDVINFYISDANAQWSIFWISDAVAVEAYATQKDFANGTIKLSDNKTYKWSEIRNDTPYNGRFANVDDGIEYVFYLDTYGNIRSFKYPSVDVSDYILLTELYNKTTTAPGTNESGALISDGTTSTNGKIVETVTTAGAAAEYKAQFVARYGRTIDDAIAKFDLSPLGPTEYQNYLRGAFDTARVDYAWTNLAAYSLSSGTVSLSIAEEIGQNLVNGNYPGRNKYVGLVKLTTAAIAADQKHFDYTDTDFNANAMESMSDATYANINDNTVVYFVIDDDETNVGVDKVYTKVGYDSIPAIPSGIHAVYALCDKNSVEAGGDNYFVANILVIELTVDPFVTVTETKEVILNLSNVTKTAGATAEYDFVGPDGNVVENSRLNADFLNGQDSYLEPMTFYVKITTTTVSPTGTKVETAVNPALYSVPSSDLPGVSYGTIFRTNGLVSYVDLYLWESPTASSIPLAPAFKVYKFVETATVIDGVTYYTYSLVPLTAADVTPGDKVIYYSNSAGQIVYMLDVTKSTGTNPDLYGNPLS